MNASKEKKILQLSLGSVRAELRGRRDLDMRN